MENERIFQQLIPEIVEIYGDLLVSVILYGSVARGTQTDESDIDIAVMLRNKENNEIFLSENLGSVFYVYYFKKVKSVR